MRIGISEIVALIRRNCCSTWRRSPHPCDDHTRHPELAPYQDTEPVKAIVRAFWKLVRKEVAGVPSAEEARIHYGLR